MEAPANADLTPAVRCVHHAAVGHNGNNRRTAPRGFTEWRIACRRPGYQPRHALHRNRSIIRLNLISDLRLFQRRVCTLHLWSGQRAGRLAPNHPSSGTTVPSVHCGMRGNMVPSSNADRFKRKAESCRQLAARVSTEADSNAWLRLAEEWDRLAELASQGRGIFDRYD